MDSSWKSYLGASVAIIFAIGANIGIRSEAAAEAALEPLKTKYAREPSEKLIAG